MKLSRSSKTFNLLKGGFSIFLLIVAFVTITLVCVPDVLFSWQCISCLSIKAAHQSQTYRRPPRPSLHDLNETHPLLENFVSDPGAGNERRNIGSVHPSPSDILAGWSDVHAHGTYSGVKTILFWTGFYVKPPSAWKIKMGEVDCGQYKCNLTYDRSTFNEADALIFHLRCPSWLDEAKKLVDGGLRLPNQSWVLYNRESAWWTKGEELTPANGLFNLTMGFRRDNDIYIPTAVVKKGQYLDGYDPKKNYMEGKTGHVAVLMSMCNWGGYTPRSNYISLLKRSGLKIDVHGNCGKKCGSYENCVGVLRTYKFVLALENSLCDDYISEKPYVNGFRIGIVPIVMSKANVSDSSILPPGSFINALEFPNAVAMVKHINTVGSDVALYNSYFKWRANWTFEVKSENEGHLPYPDDYFCSLCEKLHLEKTSKTIENLRVWFEHEKCQPFPDS